MDKHDLARALQAQVTCRLGKTFTIWPEVAEQQAAVIWPLIEAHTAAAVDLLERVETPMDVHELADAMLEVPLVSLGNGVYRDPSHLAYAEACWPLIEAHTAAAVEAERAACRKDVAEALEWGGFNCICREKADEAFAARRDQP